MKRVLVLAALAAATVAGAGGAYALRSHAHASGPVAASLAGFEQVNFVSLCRFSHRAQDDPIVLPGQFGKSHDHMFFGNDTTDANSTPASLVGKPSTCDPTTDTAAYWAPTLEVNGQKVEALDLAAYYRRNTYAPVEPFPVGFMMIGGNSTSFDPQPKSVVFWGCNLESDDASVEPVDCGDKLLRMHVIFPECWDGTRLDSPDHHSHMAYATNGACPADHPVALPQLVLIIRYPVHGTSDGRITVSSGTQYSGHADFVNGWDQAALESLVDKCLNALRPCGSLR